MANEIYTALQLTATKNSATVTANVAIRQDMAGDDLVQSTQLIGTSAELIDLGEITGAPAQLLIQNLDTTNFIEVGGDSGLTVFKIKILAGKANLISPSSGTLYAKANTAAARILVVAAEA